MSEKGNSKSNSERLSMLKRYEAMKENEDDSVLLEQEVSEKMEKRRNWCNFVSIALPIFVMTCILYFILDHFSEQFSYEYIFSKILGGLIVAGSIFIYVPQITKIYAEKSAEGIKA